MFFTGPHTEIYFANLAPTSIVTMRTVQRSLDTMEQGLDTENPAYWATALLARIDEKCPNDNRRNLFVSCARKLLEAAYIAGSAEREYVERAQYVLRARPIRTLPAGRCIPDGEVRDVLRAASVRDKAIIGIALGAGLRKAEIASLHTGSLRGGFLRVVGKGGKERDVPMPEALEEAIQGWLRVRGAQGGSLFGLGERAIYDVFVLYELLPHDCRRTYISNLLLAGADVLQVAKLSGHSDPATLGRYDRRGDNTRTELVRSHVHVPGL